MANTNQSNRVRIVVRVANYAESTSSSGHLHTFRTVDIESPELAAYMRLHYGNRAHAEVIGAELLPPAPQES